MPDLRESGFAASLTDDVVHVLRFALDGATADLMAILDEGERDRADRFVFDADRRRFIVAHAVTRLALARCLRVSPPSLRFHVGPHGKPSLAGTCRGLRFNLSHAGERGLLAIGVGRELGVDIERERAIEVLAVARRYFSSDEYHAIASLPDQERIRAFYRCWTRKESLLKARGEGLSAPLNGFVVSLQEHASQLLVAPAEIAAGAWTITAVPTAAGYVGAVTAAGTGWRLACWDVRPTV